MRDEDLVAEKLENILFESLRSLGDAGDSGRFRKGAFGDAKSVSLKLTGDRGLFGLRGAAALSFAFLPRIASDKVDDFGILRSCLRGDFPTYKALSAALRDLAPCLGLSTSAGNCRSTSANVFCRRESSCGQVIARLKRRCGASGEGCGDFTEDETWAGPAAGKYSRAGTPSVSLCLPMAVSKILDTEEGYQIGADREY
jgi:hypothetical protein